MYTIETTSKFKKDLKKAIKAKKDIELLKELIKELESSGTVHQKYKPHKLVGNYLGLWECHINPDWLLIWMVDKKAMVIELIRLGSHSELFK